ncbi:MAG: CAP domain-containing protein [Polaromonas sp.]|nr:CAP domain-containing protein [Polaromonas sp.]
MHTPRPCPVRHAFYGLALALLSAGSHGQTVAEHPGLLNALNNVRQQGCETGAKPAAPLRENSTLSRAAMLIANGGNMNDALGAVGYRAVRAAQINVSGASGEAALARKTLDKSCSVVTQPELAEAGFHQRGKLTWLLVAARFMPPLAEQADEMQARILALVNEARARPRRCGNDAFAPVQPLLPNSTLQQVAAVHAIDMATHGYFSHTGRDGSTADLRANRLGYRWRAIGENIATGLMQADTAVLGWLNSPSHCATIMSPNFQETGVAFALSSSTTASNGIYWVQVFGTPR